MVMDVVACMLLTRETSVVGLVSGGPVQINETYVCIFTQYITYMCVLVCAYVCESMCMCDTQCMCKCVFVHYLCTVHTVYSAEYCM